VKTFIKVITVTLITSIVVILFYYLWMSKTIEQVIPELDEGPEIITDSSMTFWEATNKISKPLIPAKIRENLSLVNITYYSFDGKIHKGQVVIHQSLEEDIKEIFRIAMKEKFPIGSAIPVSHPDFQWNDDKTMEANNTSAFNYRVSTGSKRLSQHAYGCAIDINPENNPYVKKSIILPKGASYNKKQPGTLTKDSIIVKTFTRLGWTWGGNWKSLKDYQHFEKKINE